LEGSSQPSGFAMQLADEITVFYGFVKVLAPTLAKLQYGSNRHKQRTYCDDRIGMILNKFESPLHFTCA